MDDYSDVEDDDSTILAKSKGIGTSDMQLARQLELARQNSLIQDGKRVAPMQLEAPSEGTIYEGTFYFFTNSSFRFTHDSIYS